MSKRRETGIPLSSERGPSGPARAPRAGKHEQAGCRGIPVRACGRVEIFKSLSDDEWNLPSGCEGWSTRDVLAHLASTLHGIVDPALMPDMSGGTEAAMEAPVAERRTLPVEQVLDEYETFSEQAGNIFAMAQDPPMADMELAMNDLGTHKMSIFASTFTFDVYTHLRHDVLRPRGSIDRPEPPRDDARIGATLEWLLAGLPWMCAAQLEFVDRPFVLTLTGPGGGSWTIAPGGDEGRVTVTEGADAAAVATITSDAHDFVAWSTHRRPWRECVELSGDAEYASQVLDAIRLI